MLYLVFRNPLAQMEEEKKEHELKMKKMEHDMEQVFESKVNEKMMKLRDSEAEVSVLLFISNLTSNTTNTISCKNDTSKRPNFWNRRDSSWQRDGLRLKRKRLPSRWCPEKWKTCSEEVRPWIHGSKYC